MSKFEDAFSQATGMNGGPARAAFVCEGFPELSQAMSGVWDQEKRKWTRPPATLSIWIEGPYVKVCLGIDENFPKWFWSTDSLEALTEQMEAALVKEQGNFHFPSERKRR
jgi:hypothetical protein